MRIKTNYYLAVEPAPALEPAASAVRQGDVAFWLAIAVALTSALVWFFRELGEIKGGILKQNILLTHAVEHIQKLEGRLEDSDTRFYAHERRLLKLSNVTNQLARSSDVLTNKVESIESFLERSRVPFINESGEEVSRSYRKSVRLELAHPSTDQISEDLYGDHEED